MLSRVADSLYWMSRYIERSENIARLIDVNRQSILDVHDTGRETDYWKPILYTFSEEESIPTEFSERDDFDVGYFVGLEKTNPNSVASCIAHARENARAVRDQLSEEMWLELNSINLFFQSEIAGQLWNDSPDDFCSKVIRFSLLFQGLSDSTIPRNEGFRFIQLGRYLERADKTSRITDLMTYGNQENQTVSHAAVLRSCSAFSAFRNEFGGRVSVENVAMFLLFSPSFPRSVRFCIEKVNESLHAVSGSPPGLFSNEVERIAGGLQGSLSFTGIEELRDEGLHAFIDNLQTSLNSIGEALFETYVLLPGELDVFVPEPARFGEFNQFQQRQQEQQQQQQQ